MPHAPTATSEDLAAQDWSPARLYSALLDDEALFVLDLRRAEEHAAWPLRGRRPLPSLNVPYVQLLAEVEGDDLAEAATTYARQHWSGQLPTDRTIVVVCAKGGASAPVAEALRRLGYRAVNLQGGMAAWAEFYAVQPVVEARAFSIYQVARPGRGCLSYLVASDGQGVVIDPLRHTRPYLDLADRLGVKLVAVMDTHGHADHLSSGQILAETLGIPYYLHPYDAIHPIDVLTGSVHYQPLWEGNQLRVGNVTLHVLHVPGHTLGNVVFYLPQGYLFSGDSIYIQSVARPDLGGRGESWSPLHYRSLARLLSLPEETVVLPGHFNSLAEADQKGLFAQALGPLRHTNEGLRQLAGGEEAFVRYLLSNLPAFPPQYVEIKRINAGLLEANDDKAAELEIGPNLCALAAVAKA